MVKESNEILSVNSLKIGYLSGKRSITILHSLKASACEGELVAVIGRNGTGKSTLLRTIAGLQPKLDGTVMICGKPLHEYSRLGLSKEVGYISTETVRVSNMKVYDLAALGRFPHTNWLGRIDEHNHRSVLDALAKAGMSEFKERLISELSDGERQRAMISMVLAQDAAVMVMDEPTAFLDVGSKFEILHLLHELTRQRNKTIIFSTHDLTAALNQADKIWLIIGDKLIEGAPEDIMLSGAFNNLFDKNFVSFNQSDGSFFVKNEIKGIITVEGTGIYKFWAKKALQRIGYKVTDSGTCNAIVRTPDKAGSDWIYKTGDSESEFRSIYELARWIIQNEPLTACNIFCDSQ